ncbi:MAG: hypothetical protein A2052_03410 [Deltaproteobacteria bacterium GWA2_54_12]|nr:MAG: hypothetical protein A2052_03410 [Deltaproteobacteria bacterium GWA2_54_12]
MEKGKRAAPRHPQKACADARPSLRMQLPVPLKLLARLVTILMMRQRLTRRNGPFLIKPVLQLISAPVLSTRAMGMPSRTTSTPGRLWADLSDNRLLQRIFIFK